LGSLGAEVNSSAKNRRFRGVGNIGWHFQEVKAGHARDHLIFGHVHLHGKSVGGLLDGAAVNV
jgi:hypothetical protein